MILEMRWALYLYNVIISPRVIKRVSTTAHRRPGRCGGSPRYLQVTAVPLGALKGAAAPLGTILGAAAPPGCLQCATAPRGHPRDSGTPMEIPRGSPKDSIAPRVPPRSGSAPRSPPRDSGVTYCPSQGRRSPQGPYKGRLLPGTLKLAWSWCRDLLRAAAPPGDFTGAVALSGTFSGAPAPLGVLPGPAVPVGAFKGWQRLQGTSQERWCLQETCKGLNAPEISPVLAALSRGILRVGSALRESPPRASGSPRCIPRGGSTSRSPPRSGGASREILWVGVASGGSPEGSSSPRNLSGVAVPSGSHPRVADLPGALRETCYVRQHPGDLTGAAALSGTFSGAAAPPGVLPGPTVPLGAFKWAAAPPGALPGAVVPPGKFSGSAPPPGDLLKAEASTVWWPPHGPPKSGGAPRGPQRSWGSPRDHLKDDSTPSGLQCATAPKGPTRGGGTPRKIPWGSPKDSIDLREIYGRQCPQGLRLRCGSTLRGSRPLGAFQRGGRLGSLPGARALVPSKRQHLQGPPSGGAYQKFSGSAPPPGISKAALPQVASQGGRTDVPPKGGGPQEPQGDLVGAVAPQRPSSNGGALGPPEGAAAP
ncbi:basic salivary proline-rich protein 1-like [Homarus americanus]|uniref:basic salivary proline-rich protein 1-like n=1 Tax=Homarus americanus TaxID=6706 RepID=UPI001C463109|nr:basic salivary proline-rich protein 1-like [Homarus americanus]